MSTKLLRHFNISLHKFSLRILQVRAKSTKNTATTSDENLSPENYQHYRLEALKGVECYPHKFQTSTTLQRFIQDYDHLSKEEQSGDCVSLTGRIRSIREAGKKLTFLDIQSDDAKLQVKATKNHLDESNHEIVKLLRRGDVIGLNGFPARTKAGELSIIPKELKLLSPCIRKLPSLDKKLENHNKRYRNRHLDFLVNQENRNIFEIRSQIINNIRQFLMSQDFLEVETPILGTSVGGANARPFTTHHNELEMPMTLRVAPELYLKKLVIGGFDRVFEIGKQFRNEGIDTTHNPEFTSCEFYMAFADYLDLITLTEELLTKVVLDIHKDLIVNFNANGEEKAEINFKAPYKRLDFMDSLISATGKEFPEPQLLEGSDSNNFLSDLCKQNNIKVKTPNSSSHYLDKLFSNFIERDLIDPTFVLNHPQCMSPLAKPHRSIRGLSERFELFIAGQEVCNAYTEMNDPNLQREAFVRQQEQKLKFGDLESMDFDEDFCRALEYGLPPTAGWGMGVDRLVMILTNQKSIKEVLLFPTMKPIPDHQDTFEYEKTL